MFDYLLSVLFAQKLLHGSSALFAQLRSGARLSDDEGMLLWTGIVFALFLLPDRQLGLSAVEVVGFLSDVAPADILNASLSRKGPEHAIQSTSGGANSFAREFASSFSCSLAAITMQQCVYPMAVGTRQIICLQHGIGRSDSLSDSTDEHWKEEISSVQAFRQANVLHYYHTFGNKNCRGLIYRVEFLVVVQSLWTKALNGGLVLMQECAQIEFVLCKILASLDSLKGASGYSATPTLGAACRNCSELLCSLRVADMLLFVLSCIGENCLDDNGDSGAAGSPLRMTPAAVGGGIDASSGGWIRMLAAATALVRRIESSLRDPVVSAGVPADVPVMFLVVRNAVMKMWSFACRFLRRLYKSAAGMIYFSERMLTCCCALISTSALGAEAAHREFDSVVEGVLAMAVSSSGLQPALAYTDPSVAVERECCIEGAEISIEAIDAVATQLLSAGAPLEDEEHEAPRSESAACILAGEWAFGLIDTVVSQSALQCSIQLLTELQSGAFCALESGDSLSGFGDMNAPGKKRFLRIVGTSFGVIGKLLCHVVSTESSGVKCMTRAVGVLEGVFGFVDECMVSLRQLLWRDVLKVTGNRTAGGFRGSFSNEELMSYLKSQSHSIFVHSNVTAIATESSARPKEEVTAILRCAHIASGIDLAALAVTSLLGQVVSCANQPWVSSVSFDAIIAKALSYFQELSNISTLFLTFNSILRTNMEGRAYIDKSGKKFVDVLLKASEYFVRCVDTAADGMIGVTSELLKGIFAYKSADDVLLVVQYISAVVGGVFVCANGIKTELWASVNRDSLAAVAIRHSISFSPPSASFFNMLYILFQEASSKDTTKIPAFIRVVQNTAAIITSSISLYVINLCYKSEKGDFCSETSTAILTICRLLKLLVSLAPSNVLLSRFVLDWSQIECTVLQQTYKSFSVMFESTTIVSVLWSFCKEVIRYESKREKAEDQPKFSKNYQAVQSTIRALILSVRSWTFEMQSDFFRNCHSFLLCNSDILGEILLKLLILPQSMKTPNKFCVEILDMILTIIAELNEMICSQGSITFCQAYLQAACAAFLTRFPSRYCISSSTLLAVGETNIEIASFIAASPSRATHLNANDLCEVIYNTLVKYLKRTSPRTETGSNRKSAGWSKRSGSTAQQKRSIDLVAIIADLSTLIQGNASPTTLYSMCWVSEDIGG
jgi:hypothetical protein